MTDKQPSKADQVAALRLARANRPKTSLELDRALAVLLPKDKGSDGDVGSIRAGHQAKVGSDRLADAGMAASPSETKRGRPRIGETRDKPWEALGMSVRTWYRRQAEKREGSK